jgi:2-dehydropantoate 2-reductase
MTRVLVVGAGATGGWLGGHLARAGTPVTLVARGATGQALSRDGLVLADGTGAAGRTPLRLPVAPDVAAAAALGGHDVALVCVKSYHTEAVARELAAAGAPPVVVSFQNGIGNEARLAERLPDRIVGAATLTTGLWLVSPGTVHGSAKGGVGLAALRQLDDLAEALAAGGLRVRRYTDAAAMKWSKLLLNMLGGVTAALLGWPPARVFADRRLFDLELAAWREALAVMRCLGRRPLALPGYPVDLYARAVRWLPPALLFRLAADRLGGGRGARLPGLAADLAAGRTESEVTVLHGAVAEEGQRCGVPTPLCTTLTALLCDVAARRRPANELAGRPDALLAALGLAA